MLILKITDILPSAATHSEEERPRASHMASQPRPLRAFFLVFTLTSRRLIVRSFAATN